MKWLCLLMLLMPVPALLAQERSSVDLEREKAELLKVHRADREAHFRTDVALLLERNQDEFIYVGEGKIHRTKKSDSRKQFEEYFRDAKYSEWDDLEPPIISVSKDASMAWMIVRIRVKRTQKDASGVERESKFIYAGIMTYEKQGGKWMRVANVSTFEPVK
jgi:hypothetical protein